MVAGQLFMIMWLGVKGAAATAEAASPRDLSQDPFLHSSSTIVEDTVSSVMMPDALIHRDLQSTSRLWDISPAVISSSGMQLDLEHTVRDQVRTNYVRIDLFMDFACTAPIDPDSNDFLVVDVVNDLTAFGDGSGNRQVRRFMHVATETMELRDGSVSFIFVETHNLSIFVLVFFIGTDYCELQYQSLHYFQVANYYLHRRRSHRFVLHSLQPH
jgi:hypothetical protein